MATVHGSTWVVRLLLLLLVGRMRFLPQLPWLLLIRVNMRMLLIMHTLRVLCMLVWLCAPGATGVPIAAGAPVVPCAMDCLACGEQSSCAARSMLT